MILEAIIKINPDAKAVVRGNDIDTCEIEWHQDTTPISKSDIKTKIDELQVIYDSEEWKRNREFEYPTIQDCIHALLDGGDTLTELQEKRQEIKAKYPKS